MDDAIGNDAGPTSGIEEGTSLFARIPKVVVVKTNVDEGPMVENFAERIKSTKKVPPHPSARATTSRRSRLGLGSMTDTGTSFPSSSILLATLLAMVLLGIMQNATAVVCETAYGHEILEELDGLDEKTATADGTERRRQCSDKGSTGRVGATSVDRFRFIPPVPD